ncbi:unnamed protein product [Sympodiomycopsis kandeliae]
MVPPGHFILDVQCSISSQERIFRRLSELHNAIIIIIITAAVRSPTRRFALTVTGLPPATKVGDQQLCGSYRIAHSRLHIKKNTWPDTSTSFRSSPYFSLISVYEYPTHKKCADHLLSFSYCSSPAVAPVNANLSELIASGKASQSDVQKQSSNPANGAGVKVGESVTTATTKLNNGNAIPIVALGVYKAPNDNTTQQAVEWAFDAGYRHVDGAARYANEEAVGRAIKSWTQKSGVPREQLFITSKLWDADHERAADAIKDSLQKLQLDYIDMYLIHSPGNLGPEARIKAWKDLEAGVDAGLIKNIGVSNFDVEELDHLLPHCRIKPVVNQIESHPFFQHEELREATISRGIHIQAYSPMAQGAALERNEIKTIATKHGKTSAQVLLRWGLQIGNIILPKSLTQHRIVSNASLFDFELDSDDMELLNSLDEGMKMGKLGPAGTSQPASPGASRRASQSGGASGGALKMSSAS